MTIAALPPATVHAIGSTQVLTDPSSVVKELVDNALDAQASSISVEISINTLDLIRVIDNGHGVAPIDRGLICHRNCTSKIASLEDISGIGGRYLGFRGEALASMAELSGGVTFITRVEGEPTATQMEMNRHGELVTQRQVSNSIGTSVCVKEFLKTIPVRREAVLKGLNKTYAKVKATLQAYALARRSVRFSFKVLKAKNEKANWMYSPVAGISLFKAALQILDQNAVKQCESMAWPLCETESVEEPSIEGKACESPAVSGSLRIEALVPRDDYDTAATSNVGSFVSVDSRPVSCARGTFKKVKTLFRSYLQNTKSTKNTAKLVDPILVMNVECDSGAYDPNVEPAKDDVLFADEVAFLQSVESFFKQLYGYPKINDQEKNAKKSSLGQSGFDLLLSRKSKLDTKKTNRVHPDQPGNTAAPLLSEEVDGHVGTTMAEITEPTSQNLVRLSQAPFESLGEDGAGRIQQGQTLSVPKHDADRYQIPPSCYSNMYTADDDLFIPPDEPPLLSDEDEEADETVGRNAQTPNPWTVAKMNAPIRRKEPFETDEEGPNSFINQLPTPARTRTDMYFDNTPATNTNAIPRQHRVGLPTPRRSQPNLPLRQQQLQSSPSPHQLTNRLRREGDYSIRHQGAPSQFLATQVAEPTFMEQTLPHDPRSNHLEGFISARALTRDPNIQPPSSPHPDLPWALAYEHRKSHAVSQHRAQQRLLHQQQQRPTRAGPSHNRQLDLSQDVRSTSPTSSPHANRYAKAVAALHTSQDEGATPSENGAASHTRIADKIALDPRDPRARLMRLQERQRGGGDTGTDHQAIHKLKRVKTSALPFESVPVGEEVYALSCGTDVDLVTIRELTNLLETEGQDDDNDISISGFSGVDHDTMRSWEATLRDAVQKLCSANEGGEGSQVEARKREIELDLRAILSRIPDT